MQLSSPARLAQLLVQLRWLSIAGQAATVLVASRLLQIHLPLPQLWAVLGLLAAFNLLLWRTLRRQPRSALGWPLLQLGVDIAALTALLAASGAAANPFASLYLVPVALAAGALPMRDVMATAGFAAASYSALWLLPAQLLHSAHLQVAPLQLHLFGLWINFLLSAAIFVLFLGRLAAAARDQAAQLAALREKQLRDESLLGVGLLAASTAHELNSPLQAMQLVLDDAGSGIELDGADLEALATALARCRRHVHTLAELARGPQPASQIRPAREWLEEALQRWRILHPAIVLELEPAAAAADQARVEVDALLTLALLNLLDNAAQASQRNGQRALELGLAATPERVEITIGDHGPGLQGSAGVSTRGGLGLGLRLSNASIERAGGSVELLPRPGGGTRTRILLPRRD